MQTLRNASSLARLVVVWFALFMAAAVASPLVNPVGAELVCSAGGAMKVIVKGAPGQNGNAKSMALDCPLCASIAAPPPAIARLPESLPACAHALQGIPAARIVARTAGPLPARGPPAA